LNIDADGAHADWSGFGPLSFSGATSSSEKRRRVVRASVWGIYCRLVRRSSLRGDQRSFGRRTGKVFAEPMLYTMASPEFGRSGLRRLNEAAEVAEAVISNVQAQFEPDEFRRLVRLLGTLGDMCPTAGVELSS
jgi:hypothetical protein